MQIRRCGETDVCFCMLGQPRDNALECEDFFAEIEQQTLPEQLWSFGGLLRTLAQPQVPGRFPHPFYFAMLDGYRPEAVSLGHDPKWLKAEDAKRFEEEILSAREKCGGSKDDILEVLSCACGSAPDSKKLLKGASAFVAFRGQRLLATPSRLEQCLTIHSTLGPEDPRVKDEIWDHDTRVYRIEDYLGPCENLERIYSEALWNSTGHQQPVAQISNPDTLPYLAAEHLLLARAYGRGDEPDFESLRRDRPGMAVLPFKVLGQWRAAGIWSYRGRYDSPENQALVGHLKEFGSAASQLLSTAVSQLVIDSSNMMLFRALGNLPNADRTPLKYCRRVQRALSNLWFSKSLTVRTGTTYEVVHENAGANFAEERGCSMQRISLGIAKKPEVVDLLGFELAEFEIPFRVPDRQGETDLIGDMLRNLNEVILSEHQRARRRIREGMRKKMDMTAHQYANDINDLVIFADSLSSRGSGIPAELRLQTVRRRASQMRGYAWILRELTKSDAGALDPVAPLVLSEFSLSRDDPRPADLEAWKNYLYCEALYSAYTAKERHQDRDSEKESIFRPRDRDPEKESIFRLNFRFECPEILEGGVALPPWNREVVVNAAALVDAAKQGRDRQRPHWPLQPMSGESAKLDDLGRCSIMLWGALELLRNACEKVATMLGTDLARSLAVTVTVAIVRGDNNWQVRITIENPTSEKPRELEGYHWYGAMSQLLKNVRFENRSSSRKANYTFLLEVT